MLDFFKKAAKATVVTMVEAAVAPIAYPYSGARVLGTYFKHPAAYLAGAAWGASMIPLAPANIALAPVWGLTVAALGNGEHYTRGCEILDIEPSMAHYTLFPSLWRWAES